MDMIINECGFRYLKLDFMYAGVLYGKPTCKNSPGYQRYRHALEVCTRIQMANNGEPVTYLGCGIPLELSYQNFPLSRIGTDTMEAWDHWLRYIRFPARPSSHLALRDVLGRAFMNGIIYANDPDVIFTRSENCSLTRA